MKLYGFRNYSASIATILALAGTSSAAPSKLRGVGNGQRSLQQNEGVYVKVSRAN